MCFRKSQEGLIIAGFALATVMIIALLVTYLSNRVVDMIAIQNQVFFSKQAYWNAYSGIEIATSKNIASLSKRHGVKKFIFPKKCPCGHETIKEFNETTKKVDAIRRCPDKGYECKHMAKEKLKHLVSKEAFNIEGLGKKATSSL